MNASATLTRVLKYTAVLAVALAVVGGGVGLAVAGTDGLFSALIGTGLAIFFAAITAISIIAAIRFDIIAFFGIVMGAWLVKAVIFVVLLLVLRDQPFIQPVVLYVALVVAITGTVVIDAITVYRARIPYVSDGQIPAAEPEKD